MLSARHLDVNDLEAKLQGNNLLPLTRIQGVLTYTSWLIATQHCRTRLIATDGVFSMDGDVAPLHAIRALADKYARMIVLCIQRLSMPEEALKVVDPCARYNASLFVDDCHATGFFGPTGRGSDEYCGIYGNVEVRKRCYFILPLGFFVVTKPLRPNTLLPTASFHAMTLTRGSLLWPLS